ncbi:MAG: 50S ribosomal protein L6 [Candidatus Woesebacteria bacterium]|jgi:large subunit ribosomal protein L6
MSKVGKLPIELPEDVKLEVSDSKVKVAGPKGEITKSLPRPVVVEVKDKLATVKVKGKSKRSKSLHGTYRAIVSNMVKGVVDGWTKTLELVGTGYRAEVKGDTLVMKVGFSHPVEVDTPDGIKFSVEKNFIKVDGIDKELVGQTAAIIRSIRPPEPYKGKGIRYEDEVVRRKPGKAVKGQGFGEE